MAVVQSSYSKWKAGLKGKDNDPPNLQRILAILVTAKLYDDATTRITYENEAKQDTDAI